MSFVFETGRLWLRQITPEDVQDLHTILSDPETMQYYPAPYDLPGTQRWIDQSVASYSQNGFGLWAVTLKPEGLFIGQCGIMYRNIDGERVPEIGYHINKQYWNRGYATEAARGCLRYGFGQCGLAQIYIHTWVRNRPSQRVAEKSGMTCLKEYDKVIPDHNTVMRHVVYTMRAEDFEG